MTPAHSALSLCEFLAKNKTTVVLHSLYSPHLAPCDLLLFLNLKMALKRSKFYIMLFETKSQNTSVEFQKKALHKMLQMVA
jgi:hypothetical protein